MVARVAVTVLLIVVVVVSFPATVGVVVVVAWWLAAAFVLVIVPVGVAEATTPAHVGTPPTEATSPAVAVLPILPHCPDRRRDIEGGNAGAGAGSPSTTPRSHVSLRYSGSAYAGAVPSP